MLPQDLVPLVLSDGIKAGGWAAASPTVERLAALRLLQVRLATGHSAKPIRELPITT